LGGGGGGRTRKVNSITEKYPRYHGEKQFECYQTK
jgi:hypothetical protein